MAKDVVGHKDISKEEKSSETPVDKRMPETSSSSSS